MRLSSPEPIDNNNLNTPQDRFNEYLADQPDPLGDDYHVLLHAGLRELARLAAPVVDPITSEIESQWQADSKTAREKHEKLSTAAQAEYHQRIASIESEKRQALEKHARHYDQHRRQLTDHAEDELETLESQAKAQLRDAAQDRDYELMTADTVARESLAKARHDHNVFTEQIIPQARELMDSLESRANALFQKYRPLVGKRITSEPSATPTDHNEPPAPTPAEPEDAAAVFRAQREEAGAQIEKLDRMVLPRLFVGLWPWLLPLLISGLAVGAAWALEFLQILNIPPFKTGGPIFGIIAFVLVMGLGILLRKKAVQSIRKIYLPLQIQLQQAHRAMELHIDRTENEYQRIFVSIKTKRDETVAHHTARFDEIRKKLSEDLHNHKTKIQHKLKEALEKIEQQHRQATAEIEQRSQAGLKHAETDMGQKRIELKKQFETETADQKIKYDLAYQKLSERWQNGLDRIVALLDRIDSLHDTVRQSWDDPNWPDWMPDTTSTGVIRFGEFHPDWNALSQSVMTRMTVDPRCLAAPAVPAVLDFPDHGCLLFEYRREGRDLAMSALKAAVARLAVSLPPGRARFTLIDPVGLGENFAGFMHLADYEEALIGGRIWTEPQQIQQQLSDLTGHMENVIQKYLRNEYETIDEYNRQAGELAEPYRFLIIADFPAKISEEAARRLSSIIASGPRCGVFTLIACDSREKLPEGVRLEDIEAHSLVIRHKDDNFVYNHAVLGAIPLSLDQAPRDELLTDLMQKVGRGARETNRVEVPFQSIAPAADRMWSLHSNKILTVPVGRTGATRRQQFTLGKGVAQHALIGGKTGSGKSTLLHVLITNLALWYSPDEVEMYLIDFKKGVEFKTYVTHALPHARAVAIESDREFGLSILRQIEAEMTRRGEMFRRAGVQDLAGWREESKQSMPRILLIVDEFQVFFSEDDKLAQDAALLLEQLVRQGRAFGIHVVLGSQTLAGTSGLARGTLGQIAVRVALQCSEMDSQLILDDNNTAARLLGRPGEAIYNDAGGLIQGNSPFQVSWLDDDQRDDYLSEVNRRYQQTGKPPRSMIVFEGNIPSDIRKNRPLAESLHTTPPQMPLTSQAWIGDPVAIKEPTAVTFQRHSGSNAMIVGQRDESVLAMLAAMQLSLAAQYPTKSVSFYVFDGMPADSNLAGQLQAIGQYIPRSITHVEWRDVESTIAEIAGEVARRQEKDQFDAPAIFIMIYGMQRYRMLRKADDDFSFSMDDGPKPAKPDKQFAEILREGPAVGVHTIIWSDTMATLERTFDRNSMREFDNRILFQLSASDSSNLIDTPAANQLGQHRALLYSEEHGTIEKFRPYAIPPLDWLKDAFKPVGS